MERKGKVIPCRWSKDEKGAGTNSEVSGARRVPEAVNSTVGLEGGWGGGE